MDNETKEMLQLILNKVSSLEKEVSDVKQLATKTAIIQENEVAKKIQLIYENQVTIIDNNKQLDGIKNNLENVNVDVFALKMAVKQLQMVK